MNLDEYNMATVKIGFMPLTQHGMFLSVWKLSEKSTLVFVKCGTIFCIDKSVIHAGRFAPGGTEGMRLQFVFSNDTLDTMHHQVIMGNDYYHNEDHIWNLDQVRHHF